MIKNKIKFKDGYFEDILFFFEINLLCKSIKINKDIFYLKYNRKILLLILYLKNIFFIISEHIQNVIVFLKINIQLNKVLLLKGIVGLTAVYINKIIASNIVQSKKISFLTIYTKFSQKYY